MASPAPVLDITEIPLGDLLRGKSHIRIVLLADYTEKPLKVFLATCRREALRAKEGGRQLVTQLEDLFKSLNVTWP